MESSIAAFLMRWLACELLPTMTFEGTLLVLKARVLSPPACVHTFSRPHKLVWRSIHGGKKHQSSSLCPVERKATYQDDVAAISCSRTDLLPFTNAGPVLGE